MCTTYYQTILAKLLAGLHTEIVAMDHTYLTLPPTLTLAESVITERLYIDDKYDVKQNKKIPSHFHTTLAHIFYSTFQ